jgi:M6 family metalloprotease-like protein
MQIWDMEKFYNSPSETRALVTGTKKVLCVLASFSNKAMNKTQEQFDNLCNQVGYTTGGNKGSVADFYKENSYNQMTLEVTVVGPVTLSNTLEYYAPEGQWRAFAKAVAVAADPLVDFSQFAVSGRVPTFHIIFAGYGDEAIDNGQQIWSHAWSFSSTSTLDGVVVGDRYSCSPELVGWSGSNMTTIGVLCHELCHTFGAPDYYDTNYGTNGEYPGTGDWDLMASGSYNGSGNNGSCPAHINMHQKIIYGWVNPTTLTTAYTVTNQPNSAENPVAYIIKPYTNNEMYVIENKQKVGFDSYLPGHGLLILHIHNSAASGSCNNTRHPQQAYPVCASATTAIPTSTVSTYGNVDTGGCPFPGTSNKASFTGTSTPRMFRWNGTDGVAVTGKEITDIAENTSAKTVSWKFMGGAAPLTKDIEVSAVTSPVSGQNLSSTEPVVVTLKNNGTTNAASVALQLKVDGGDVATETWTGNLAQNATTDYTFTAEADLSAAGNHSIEVVATLAGDELTTNNTLSVQINNIICHETLPYTQNFESIITTAYDAAGNHPDCWDVYSDNTSYPAPHVIASSGYSYIAYTSQSLFFVNSNAGYNSYAILPEFSGLDNASISFYVKWENTTHGVLKLGYVTNASSLTSASSTFTNLIQIPTSANQTVYTVNLSSYTIPSGARLAFYFYNTGAYYGLIIDDVNIATLPIAKDVEITKISGIESNYNLSATTPVTATLTNNGTNTVTSCNLKLVVDNTLVTTETWTGSLVKDAATDYTFTAKADLSADGNHTVTVIAALSGDEVTANDTASVTVVNTIKDTKNFKKIQSDSDLEDGKDYIIVYENKALGEQDTDNRTAADIVVSGDATTTIFAEDAESTLPYIVKLGKNLDDYTLYDVVNAQYLRPRSDSDIGLQLSETPENWSITVDISGVTATSTAYTSNNMLKFDTQSNIFACYDSGITNTYDVSFYREVLDASPTIPDGIEDIQVCASETVTLPVVEYGMWYKGNDVVTTATETGVYTLVIENPFYTNVASIDINVTINALPEVLCPTDDIEIDNATSLTLEGATPLGGIYSGEYVSEGIFNAEEALIDAGNYEITYSYTDENNCSNSCAFSIKVKIETKNNIVENAKFAVYPNPNNGHFNLDLSAINNAKRYQIIDSKGAIVYEEKIVNKLQQVNINLVAGRYIVKVFTNDKAFVENIVIH